MCPTLHRWRLLFGLALPLAWIALELSPLELSAQEPLEYNRDVRPILAENCFACHGADSASRKAELRLDQREAAVDSGVLTPGEPDDSELLARVFSDDPELVMPPPENKKKLTEREKQTLRRWIASGAEYQPHWSLIAPVKPNVADVAVKSADWIKNPIDRFVLAGLEGSGLTPAPEASPRTLFRRLHLDITGLPPAPDDATAFESDYQKSGDKALSDWIDRLMETTAWGEHRARYWLDAARYGDTHGLHFDNYREMWPYRDWVIRSFNANQPFDQFTIEQLAGDLLPNPTDDQLIATGFQRCNITTNEGGTIDEENLANYAADRVQTFGWVYLGLTTNCCQCHDHKFDPLTMRDYYSLAAYFRNTTQGPKDGNVKDGRGPVLIVPMEEDRARWLALPDEITAATESRDARKKVARGEYQKWLATLNPAELAAKLPTADLLVHVPLNEGTGKTVKSSGAGIEAFQGQEFVSGGDVRWIKDGKIGAAPVIKAGSTFDLGPIGDFERDQGFSYGAWVRPARKNASTGILAKMDEQAMHRGWDLWQNGGQFSVHIVDAWPDNAIKVTTRDAVVKPGKWQHVFATYDGSGKPGGVKIFVDGKLQPTRVDMKTLKADASIRTETPLRIGQRSQGAVFDGGSLQDVRVYARPLADAEIQSLADNVVLQTLLALPKGERTKQQETMVFAYYLATQDAEYAKLAKAATDLESELETIRKRSPVTHIQREKPDSMAMAHILTRGEYDRPTEQVTATTPAALHALADAPKNRLGLAQWTVDPANALTARVTVNRFWQEVFGQGIVATPEDFGVMGALPTHPELLDWLAIDFRESGWDVKRFFKMMLMSATYRQSARFTPDKLERDQDNWLLSRGPRFRMDAEMVRDHALAASGLLSPKLYGPSVRPYQPVSIWDIVGLPGGNTRNYVQDNGESLYRRTMYTFWKRMAPPPSMDAFNAPSREVCTVRRERTNTPLQALVTLNDPQFVEAARFLAQHAMGAGGDDTQIANFIAQRVIGRPLQQREVDILLADKTEYLTYYKSKLEDAQSLISVGESKAPADIDPPTLAAWTLVCNEVMNLDEALTK